MNPGTPETILRTLLLILALAFLAGCSSAPSPPSGSAPSGWSEGDPEMNYSRLPVVNGLPLDAKESVYLSTGDKIVVQLIAVETEISDDRKARWGLIHKDMLEAYNEELTSRQTHVLGEEQEDHLLKLDDGQTVNYHKVRIKPGALAGEDVVWGTGSVRKGDKLLIVNVGCLSGDYDPDQVSGLLDKLSWEP